MWKIIVVAILFIPVIIWLSALLQEWLLKFVASRFLRFQISGNTMRACLLGIISGIIATGIVSEFTSGILVLIVGLMSTWPFILLWTKKGSNESTAVSHKEAAILSAASSFASWILLYAIYVVVTSLIAAGVIASLVSASSNNVLAERSSGATMEVPSPLIGKLAPSFTVPQLADQAKSFSPGDMKGKVWVLSVWSSWSNSCRQAHPLLVEFSHSGVVPLIGLDYKDSDADAISFLKNQGNPYELVVSDVEGRIGIDYGVYGVPELYVIDKGGVIRYKVTGSVTQDVLNKTILPLVNRLNANAS